MKTEIFMGNLPEKVKEHIKNQLCQGVIPRSGEYGGVEMHFPNWDRHQWKIWAKSNGVDLPHDFLKVK